MVVLSLSTTFIISWLAMYKMLATEKETGNNVNTQQNC